VILPKETAITLLTSTFFRVSSNRIAIAASLAWSRLAMHFTLLTDAAAARRLAKVGNAAQTAVFTMRFSSVDRKIPTVVAPAVQMPPSADVKGRIEPSAVPWFAYESDVAAERILSARASVQRATANSAIAR